MLQRSGKTVKELFALEPEIIVCKASPVVDRPQTGAIAGFPLGVHP